MALLILIMDTTSHTIMSISFITEKWSYKRVCVHPNLLIHLDRDIIPSHTSTLCESEQHNTEDKEKSVETQAVKIFHNF